MRTKQLKKNEKGFFIIVPLSSRKTSQLDKKQVEDENLFSTDGLKPSIHDLDNIFEDSDTELNLDGTQAVPTPPSSVKVVQDISVVEPSVTIFYVYGSGSDL
jgi:hypothetical protein